MPQDSTLCEFIKYVLSICGASGMVPGTWDILVNKTGKNPYSHGLILNKDTTHLLL